MKIKVNTKCLKDALARVANIPGAHGASVHTQAVKLTADLAGLSLTRFTSEAKIVVTLEDGVEVFDDGREPSVSHSGLKSLVDACNAAETTIEADDKFLHLISGRSKWKLKVFDSEIMIDPPEPELETEHINILIEDLVELLSFVSPAASKDNAGTPAFCGVNMAGRKMGLFFTATDSKRCYMAAAPYGLNVNCTIPNEGVAAILRAIGSSKGAGTLSVGETFVTLSSSTLEISTALLSDPYPKGVADLVERSESSILSKITVNRDEFTEALESCATVSESDRIVNLKAEDGVLEISGGNTRDAEGVITMDCESTASVYDGVPGADMAAVFKKLKVDDGKIELSKTATAIFVKQPERIAFFALAKPRKID